MSAQIGPFRIMPARVRAAFEYLNYSLSVEHGCGEKAFCRDLDGVELATKGAALQCLQLYLCGENDYADVLHYAHPVPAELLNGDIVECRSSEACGSEIAMKTGEDDA